MKKTIKIRPEWVLEKMPHTSFADGEGNISIYTACATDACWIELALETLGIIYDNYDVLDDYDDLSFGFDFRIEDIQDECPSLYKRMKEIDLKNMIRKNFSKN